MELWVGCVAGALEESTYRSKLSGAGFEAIDVEPTRIYRAADAKQFLEEAGLSDDATLAQVDGRIMSAFIRATQAGRCREELLWTDVLCVRPEGPCGAAVDFAVRLSFARLAAQPWT